MIELSERIAFRTSSIILFILLILTAGCDNNKNDLVMNDDIREKAVVEVIHSRKSVRSFIDRPVSDNDLETLVRAGMAAPTGKNMQPWVFYIIKDKDLLERLGSELPTAAMLGSVHSAIMVCGDLTKADTTSYRNYWVMDCSAASENILLTAESMGLGACWTAVFPYDSRQSIVRKYITMPQHHVPLNIIPVGYPAGMESPKDKWDPGNVIIIE